MNNIVSRFSDLNNMYYNANLRMKQVNVILIYKCIICNIYL